MEGPARLFRPSTDLPDVPQVTRLQPAHRLRKVGVTGLPHVDGVGPDSKALGDLGGTHEVRRQGAKTLASLVLRHGHQRKRGSQTYVDPLVDTPAEVVARAVGDLLH